MRCQFRVVILGLILSVLVSMESFAVQPKNGRDIDPDPKVQDVIRRVVYAEQTRGHIEAMPEFKMIRELALTKTKEFAPQLIYFAANTRNETEAVGVIGIVILLKNHSELRLPTVPFLESEEKRVRETAEMFLRAIDEYNPQNELFAYQKLLIQQKEKPPPGLVRYLFEFSASKALLRFGQAYSDNPREEPRDLMWSDHVVSSMAWRHKNKFLKEGDMETVRKELDMLSKHPGWYARYYAAFRIGGVPAFSTPEILNRLRKETNPLVVEAANRVRFD